MAEWHPETPTVSSLCLGIRRLVAEGPEAALVRDTRADAAAILEERSHQLLSFSKHLAAASQRRKDSSESEASRVRSAIRWAPIGEWAEAAGVQTATSTSFLLGLLIVAITLPYYICTTYSSWFVDEGFAIYRNPDAKGETPISEVLKHDFWGTSLNPPEGYNTHKSYRPLVTLMYAAEWQMAQKMGFGGQEMKPMRLVSCLVHSATSAMVLRVLLQLGSPGVWAFIGAALFAAHPIHIENIVYLVGRADSLSTLFMLLAFSLYLRDALGLEAPQQPAYLTAVPGGKASNGFDPKSLAARLGTKIAAAPKWRWRTFAIILLLTAAAGLCKEPGFTVLFFLACAELVVRCRPGKVVAFLVGFALLGAIRTWYVGGTEAGFGYVDTPIRYMDSKLTRTLSYLHQHAYYAKLLLLPWHQSWDYSFDAIPMVETFTDLRMQGIVASYLAIFMGATLGLRTCGRSPILLLGVGFIVIPFIPASNLFFLVGTTVGERLLYPCTVGWSMVVVAAAGIVGRPPRVRGALLAGLGCLLGIYIWNSNVRMSHWQSTSTLFETDALHWSKSVKVLHSKASELQARDDLHGALEHYLKSLEVFDDQAITDYCIARIYLNLGRFSEAHTRFDKILNGHGIGFHDGNDFLWMTDLGYLLVKLGALEGGVHYLTEGLSRMPYSCYGWNALGVGQANLGQLEVATQSLMQALQCDPDSAIIWSNLAVVFLHRQQIPELTEAIEKARSLEPTLAVIQNNFRIFSGLGLPGEMPKMELYIPLPGRR